MRPIFVITTLFCLFGVTAVAIAQDAEPAPDAPVEADAAATPDAPDAPDVPAVASDAPEAASDAPDSGSEAVTSAEAGEQPSTAPAAETAAPELAPSAAADLSAVPSPGELDARLDEEMPDTFDAADTWTAPTPVLTLHGYMRMRLELLDSLWLGRRIPTNLTRTDGPSTAVIEDVQQEPDPFTRFRPAERRVAQTACGASGEDTVTEGDQTYCDVSTVRHANIRLRLSPQLNISEDVRVKTSFDVLDNVNAGTAPESFYGSSPDGIGLLSNATGTDTIRVRRAWGEVRNRDLGELRFGRMPNHWGLGMLHNSGDGLDHDFQTDIDRLLIVTKLAGFYLGAGYDFPAEGVASAGGTGENQPAYDVSQVDDVDQWTFTASRHLDDEDRAAQLERGEAVLEGGVQLRYRDQDAVLPATDQPVVALAGYHYTPDLWGRLSWRGITIGAEAAWVLGEMRTTSGATVDIDQLGAVLETEFRFLDDKLAISYDTGFATGDSEVEGLSSGADYLGAEGVNGTISTFRFHPSYQVDMILWRNIMRQVTGAYYFKPGISYDFVRDEFGQLFGARLDLIWSRASAFIQAPGNDPDLGVELNVKLYWTSDDGPNPEDGYHARLEYGVLFPMQGLGYHFEESDLDLAQQLRLLVGVSF